VASRKALLDGDELSFDSFQGFIGRMPNIRRQGSHPNETVLAMRKYGFAACAPRLLADERNCS
jgi:hypothetical protein